MTRSCESRRAFRTLVATSVSLTSLLGAGRAIGQSGPAPVAAASHGGIEAIVVTARKRRESAQNVPVSITAITAKQINKYDLTSLEKVAAATPQLNVARSSNGSGAQITLRGIGSQATSIGLEQSTAVVVDGVYYGQGRVIDEAFLDLSRIELLKGPQALFFGKNATAGVINITTADPTDVFQAMARVGYEFQAKQVVSEGFVSGPVAPELTMRLAGKISNMYGNLFDNHAVPTPITTVDIANGVGTTREQQPSRGGFPGTEDKALRGTVKWQPRERLSFVLKGSFNQSDDDADAANYVPVACANANGTSQTNPAVRCRRSFTIYQPDAPTGFGGGGVPGTNANGQPYDHYESAGVTGTLNWRPNNVTISSVTNYNWNTNQYGLGLNVESPTDFVAAHENTSFWSFSNENRLQTTFDFPVNAMIGTYYQKTKRDYEQNGAFVGVTDSAAPPGDAFDSYAKLSQSIGETKSLFSQLTWNVISNVELAGGVRYINETKDSYLDQPYINPALQSLFVQYDTTNPATRVLANQRFHNLSPESTLTYRLTPKITLYGAYKTAYKSGGFSNSAFAIAGAPATNLAFNPENARGFETGLKTTLFNRQLRFNIDAYTYKYTNLQVDYFNSINFQFITTNAGSATTKGIETELEYAPLSIPDFNLHGTLNYNDAQYQNYTAPCYAGESIAAGCDTVFNGGLGQNLSGRPTAIAPKWTASLGADYDMALTGGWRIAFALDGRFSSSYLASSFAEPLSRQDAYFNLDAALRVHTEDDRWDIALIARNLTNAFYISGALDAPDTGSGTGTSKAEAADILGLANPPRTVRLQVTMRY